MRGRELHTQKLEQNKDYLRRRAGAVEKLSDQYLTNDLLRGKVDEVLVLNDGTMAPLDYKFAVYENVVYLTYKTQLHCYAVLIEDNFSKQVNKGFLVYVRSKNKLIEVEISSKDKKMIKETAENILQIVEKNVFPRATHFKKRCLGCTYANICIK